MCSLANFTRLPPRHLENGCRHRSAVKPPQERSPMKSQSNRGQCPEEPRREQPLGWPWRASRWRRSMRSKPGAPLANGADLAESRQRLDQRWRPPPVVPQPLHVPIPRVVDPLPARALCVTYSPSLSAAHVCNLCTHSPICAPAETRARTSLSLRPPPSPPTTAPP